MRKNYQRFLSVAAAAVLSAALLTGCNGSAKADNAMSSYSMSEAPMAMEKEASSFGYDMDMPAYDDAEYDFADVETQTQAELEESAAKNANRKLIKNVSLSMETLEFDKCCALVNSYAEQLGGYIENSDVSNDSMYMYYSADFRRMRSASFTVRIPSEKLDMYVETVGNMGSVTSRNENTQDVTLSYLDVESRIKSLKIQQDRLFELLEKAETVDEIIQLEDRICEVTYELEAQESIRRNYDSLVSFSTVNMYVMEVEHVTPVQQAPKTVGERITSGLSETFYDIAEGFKNFAVWFVVNLPYIIVWAAIITGIVIFIVKLVKHRKKKNAKKRAELQAQQAAARGMMYVQPTAQPQANAQPVQAQMNVQPVQAQEAQEKKNEPEQAKNGNSKSQ